ncbi:hypothetical protein KR054_006508, partial [Drosophila jambulina]
MSTYKIKAMPLVAKILSLRRTTTTPQQQQKQIQSDTQKDEASPASSDTSEPKEEIPPSKLSKTKSENRRWEAFTPHMSTVKLLLAVLVICAMFGMIPLYRRPTKKLGEPGIKVIMLWNEEPGKNRAKESARMECGCIVTKRRKDYEMAVDAFVFNAHRPYSLKYLPNINRTDGFLTVFAARNPLSLAKEPPASDRALFNLTMTYRLDSQLVWSEYYFSALNQAKRLNSFSAPSEHYADNMPGYELQLLDKQTRPKDRLAMYFHYEVDEAHMPQSKYLAELRKYIDLDAYGKCVGYDHCNHYFFMLIFDPIACPDYVPTQIYEAIYKYVVPVLIGGGNLHNLLPPQSYISSRDFPKPQDLVAHLEHLERNKEEYKRYFWWHSLYKLRRTSAPYCQLCSLLQQPQEERRIET